MYLLILCLILQIKWIKQIKHLKRHFLKIATKLEQSFEKTGSEAAFIEKCFRSYERDKCKSIFKCKDDRRIFVRISTVIMSEHKTIKKSLEMQEETNKLLVELINNLKK